MYKFIDDVKKNRPFFFQFWIQGKNPLIISIIGLVSLIYVISFSFIGSSNSLGLVFTPIYTVLFLLIVNNYSSMKKERIYMNSFMQEIYENLYIFYNNLILINSDEELLDKNRYQVEPIYYLYFDMWDVIKENINLESLKMDLTLLRFFIISSKKYNQVVQQRNNLQLGTPGFKETRHTYNKFLKSNYEEAKKNLLNALSSRGEIIEIPMDDETKTKFKSLGININLKNIEKDDVLVVFQYKEY